MHSNSGRAGRGTGRPRQQAHAGQAGHDEQHRQPHHPVGVEGLDQVAAGHGHQREAKRSAGADEGVRVALAAPAGDRHAIEQRQHRREHRVQQQRDAEQPGRRLAEGIAQEQQQRGGQRGEDQAVRAAALVGHVRYHRRGQDLGQERGRHDQADQRRIEAAAGEPQGKKGDADALQAVVQEVEPMQGDGALPGVGVAAHNDVTEGGRWESAVAYSFGRTAPRGGRHQGRGAASPLACSP